MSIAKPIDGGSSGERRPLRVFLLQDILPNYRVPVFRRIGALPGIELTVFHSDPSARNRAENLRNADDTAGVHTVKLPIWDCGPVSYQFGFAAHIARARPDVVICGQAGRADMLLFLALCKLLRIPFLWFLGGVPYLDPAEVEREVTRKGLLNSLLGRYNPRRWLVNRAAGMIVYSEHAKAYFASLGFSADRIFVAPNSPDTEALNAYREELERQPEIVAQLRARFAPRRQRIVLLLGRLNSERGTAELIDAFAALRIKQDNIVLVIVGDGAERLALEERVRQLRLSDVHFAGGIYAETELAKYFQLCDVLVMPAAASLAGKQAMAFGKPVIAADFGLEIHHMQHGVNGLIVPRRNVAALTQALDELFANDGLYRQLALGARETIEQRVNIQRMVGGFQQAIASTVKPRDGDAQRPSEVEI